MIYWVIFLKFEVCKFFWCYLVLMAARKDQAWDQKYCCKPFAVDSLGIFFSHFLLVGCLSLSRDFGYMKILKLLVQKMIMIKILKGTCRLLPISANAASNKTYDNDGSHVKNNPSIETFQKQWQASLTKWWKLLVNRIRRET